MSDAQSDPGTMLKLGFVVLCVGGCALGMLALRQAGLQAGHELAQTQLRIQKADEDLWKLRADIATLAAPARVRELADKLGPLHGLTPRPADPAGEPTATDPAVNNPARPAPRQANPPNPQANPAAKSPPPSRSSNDPRPQPQPAPAKPGSNPTTPATKPPAKPSTKPPTKPTTSPTSAPRRAPASPNSAVL